jgi:hypothetical protein
MFMHSQPEEKSTTLLPHSTCFVFLYFYTFYSRLTCNLFGGVMLEVVHRCVPEYLNLLYNLTHVTTRR